MVSRNRGGGGGGGGLDIGNKMSVYISRVCYRHPPINGGGGGGDRLHFPQNAPLSLHSQYLSVAHHHPHLSVASATSTPFFSESRPPLFIINLSIIRQTGLGVLPPTPRGTRVSGRRGEDGKIHHLLMAWIFIMPPAIRTPTMFLPQPESMSEWMIMFFFTLL